MKSWIRTGAIAALTASAVLLGFTAASAGPMTITPPTPAAHRAPAGPGHQAASMVAGPARSETLVVPINPCRIVDTRRGGGVMASNAARSFYVTGTAGFVGQGGTGGGCGVPGAATGIATNVTTVGTLTDGYLTGYPTGSAEPGTNFMTSHANVTTTVNPTLALATAAASAETPLTVVSHGSTTHLIIDVTGYDIPQISGAWLQSGVQSFGTSRILSTVHTGPGTYTVTVDSDVSTCVPIVNAFGGHNLYGEANTFSGNVVTVYMWTMTSGGTSLPADAAFYLKVDC